MSICIVHILTTDVLKCLPGVKGDPDVHVLLITNVSDFDSPRQGLLLDQAALQGNKTFL